MRYGKLRGLFTLYLLSTLVFTVGMLGKADGKTPLTAMRLGVLSLDTVYPGMVDPNLTAAQAVPVKAGSGEDRTESGAGQGPDDTGGKTAETDEDSVAKPALAGGADAKEDGSDPAVLILHTHATETYLPASGGNYHSKKKENSVRDVGQVLAESLQEEGIAVVHDETLHDNPSYSNSYSRSYETASALLEQYPSIRCVIDLHRDAIASEGTGATVSAGGSVCARYMYVVSTAVPTYTKNRTFIDAMNRTAQDMYDGFTGNVLERGYAYNQGLCDCYLLVEFGNNRNDIEDVRNTARLYGKVLAKVLKAGE